MTAERSCSMTTYETARWLPIHTSIIFGFPSPSKGGLIWNACKIEAQIMNIAVPAKSFPGQPLKVA